MSTLVTPALEFNPQRVSPHPWADNLELYAGPQGQVVIQKGQFAPGDPLVYVPADTLVRVTERTSFLAKQADKEGWARIRACKLRGQPSVGLLLPGTTDLYEFRKWEPPPLAHADAVSPSTLGVVPPPVYDVENSWVLEKELPQDVLDEPRVWHVTEKIHGANFRLLLTPNNRQLALGSRSRWLVPDGDTVWHRGLKWLQQHHGPWLSRVVLDQVNIGLCLYGEVFGKGVQDLTYSSDIQVRFFDCWDTNRQRWVAPPVPEVLCAPSVYAVYDSFRRAVEAARHSAESAGVSELDGSTVLEGYVLTTTDSLTPRIQTKVVTQAYLTRKNGSESKE